LGGNQAVFNARSGAGSPRFRIFFESDVLAWDSDTFGNQKTSQVFRDVGAWFHLCFAADSTQATAADRIKIYINGVQVTSFSSSSYPTQNADGAVNSTIAHDIGTEQVNSIYFNGYLADIYFIDGQALDPTSFGEFDATTGVWNPKAYTGSYGTNGFRLEFADNSAATATTLGKDTSGNGNNWTPNNLSVTAGAGNDSLVDVPTNGSQTDTGVGGEVRGNYATLNPLDVSSITLSNGNLQLVASAAGYVRGTINAAGKVYWEVTITTAGLGGIIGIMQPNGAFPYTNSNGYHSGGTQYVNGSSVGSWGASWTTGNVIGIAVDTDAGTITAYKNGSSQGSKAISTTVAWMPWIHSYDGTNNVNFGQRAFAYTAPSGFKALNTANLPAPLVTKPNTVMDVALWTGNGSARSITGLAFNPDLVWIKGRSGATDHALYDAVRGVQIDLVSNSTAAETTQTQGLTAFNSDGFSLGTLAKVNTSSATYAAWTWDAGSSTVTNTQGSITSSVRANATAGFSVVTYTGTGSVGTIGHGLGVTPGMMIVKRRDFVANWYVYHSSIGNTGALGLNLTNATITSSAFWNNTSPTSTVLTISNASAELNANGGTYLLYCFAPVAGYSSFGSYVGNGSTDGPFVYTGFRPRWILVKSTSSTGWAILDAARDAYNLSTKQLFPHASDGELNDSTQYLVADLLSNGFKLRTTSSASNTSSQSYIFAAFAEHPFQYARAR
jgi:hypothetical protein